MIRPSLIYAAVIILLVIVDAIRIYKEKGIVENINHAVSRRLAIGAGVVVIATTISFSFTWKYLLMVVICALAFAAIRLLLYDPLLNLARRERIDYVSVSTNDYEDNHTNKLTFWDKRILAVAGWGACVLVHYLIFKS